LNHAPSDQATVQEVHQFSPSVVNQLALGYTRFALRVVPLDQGFNIAQRLGLQGANTGENAGSMASLSISGYQGYSSSNLPEIVPQNTWQISDTISYTKGAHAFRFGASVVHNGFGFFQLGAPSGSLSFTGVYSNNPANSSGGNGFADFLLGLGASSSKSAAPFGVPYETYTEYGGFVQDTWRATNRLTVNLGFRYDLFTPLSERYNRQSDFLLKSGTLALAAQNGYSASILNTQTHDFSPRIGLAYRVGEKTVIRAAYGLFYFNEVGSGGSSRLFINNPYAAQYAVSCSATVSCLSTSTGIPNIPSASNLPTMVYQPIPNLTPNAAMEFHRGAADDAFARGASWIRGHARDSPQLERGRERSCPGRGLRPGPSALSDDRGHLGLGASRTFQLQRPAGIGRKTILVGSLLLSCIYLQPEFG
jgi:hypothetical protein